MALKGLDIFKLSPKKNCKECGCPTCMAFCMKVAQGSMQLSKCPYFSPEAVEKLSAASTPPMRTVAFGSHPLGGETVLFRHEKTFVHENLFAVSLDTEMSEAEVSRRLTAMKRIDYERIGERMYVESVFVSDRVASPECYAALVQKALASGRDLILDCVNPACARAALITCGSHTPILDGATAENAEEMAALAKEFAAPLGVRADTLSDLHDTAARLDSLGVRDLFLDLSAPTAKQTFANAVLARRSALRDGVHALGYPSIVNLNRFTPGNPRLQTAYATLFVEKYGSIVVLDEMTMSQALPLFGLRQNIFTDPQKPMKVDAGIYPICGADENAPCALTVDFALTYFLVSGELEHAGMPVNLLISDASGMSVLTAWAAGKFSAASVRKFMDDHKIAEKIKNRTLIIPGKVAVLKGEIQEQLPEWNVVVGPPEAVQLSRYMREKEYEAAARAAEAAKAGANAATQTSCGELSFEELLEKKVPKIEHMDLGVSYKGRAPDARTFIPIGERIHCISPTIRRAMDERDPAPILKRAAEQIAAGAVCLDVNIGPAEKDGPERMMWAVKLLQENFGNVPLALDTSNQKAIEAGIRVYDRTHGKPIINSADNGSRIGNIDLAAANDAICIALCSGEGIPRDCDERMKHCHQMLERGLALGMNAEDLWFDPLFLVVKGMQDKQIEILNTIRQISEAGLKSTGGLSNNSNGAPKAVRPVMDSTLIAMAMMQGLSSAIVNPCDRRLMETVRTCDIFKGNVLYSDSYLEF